MENESKKLHPLTEQIVTETEEVSCRAMSYMAQHLEEVKDMSKEERQKVLHKLYMDE